MPFRLLLAVVLLLGLTGGGEKKGRQGNALYKEKHYEAAADAYYAGLEAYETGRTDGAYYGLQNNLGAALHQQREFGVAREAFQRALSAAATPTDAARTAYNAGNNEFLDEQPEAALDYYRRALLADPTDQDAKFNYEFVKRQLEQQQQQQQDGEDENQDQQNQDQQQDQQNQDQQNQDENQDQQNQDQQNQDQQQDQQNQDQQQEQEQEQQQQPTPQEDTEQLSRQQAERILQALENDEEELLREVQKLKGRPRRVDKDW